MVKKLTLEKCEVFKQGMGKNNRPYTIYHAYEGNQKYSSFNNLSVFIGKPTDFEIDTDEVAKGDKVYKNYTIVGTAGSRKPKAGSSDEVMEALRKTYAKLVEIDKWLKEHYDTKNAPFPLGDMPPL